MKVILSRRVQTSVATWGKLIVDHGLPTEETWRTLELPWKDNATNVSCIPAGVFTFSRRYSPHNKCEVFTGVDVPNRSLVNIEVANYVGQLRGCIAVGNDIFDLNGDGIDDLAHSRAGFTRWMERMKGVGSFELVVMNPLNSQRAA